MAHTHPKNTQVPPPPGPVLSLYIYLIFLYHVNQCRVQLGTNKVFVAASIQYYSTDTEIAPMEDSLFSIFPPISEKVVK